MICADEQRLEGAKLKYEILSAESGEFRFAACDANKKVRWEADWMFEQEFDLIDCRYTLSNTGDKPVVIRRALPRWVFSPGEYNVFSHLSRWGAENILQSQSLRGADFHLHGRAARSTVGATPFCVIRDEENMSAAAFHVLPRGNWTIDIHSYRPVGSAKRSMTSKCVTASLCRRSGSVITAIFLRSVGCLPIGRSILPVSSLIFPTAMA